MNAQAKQIEVLDPSRTAEPMTLPAMTPMTMLDRAVAQGASIEVLTKLMDLQDRWEKNNARKAFDAAISAAKAEIKIVGKNRTGHNSKRYADFAAYAAQIDPIISKHGLSYRFRSSQNGTINVTCILSHRDGHSEENTLSGPADATGNKNAIQAIGSTLTYLQRYTLVQALGLAASEDDDGVSAAIGADGLTGEQLTILRSAIVEVGIDIAKVTGYAKVSKLEEIPQRHFEKVLKAVEQYKPKKEGE